MVALGRHHSAARLVLLAACASSTVAAPTRNNATATATATATAAPAEAAGNAETGDLGFFNASAGGGSWLTLARNADGLGEPLNVVVSNKSDPLLMTDAGFIDFMWSVQMSEEFLGQSLGERQAANLGDGLGQRNQTGILRYNYYDIYYGTIRESINGGSHVRFWRQNGSEADTGAWFIAASNEMSAAENHMITPNGYDLGRDALIGNATMSNGTISPITNRTFLSTAEYMSGYLPANSSEGINHYIATDGRVAVLTVTVTNNGSAAEVSAQSAASAPMTRSASLKAVLAGALGTFALALLV